MVQHYGLVTQQPKKKLTFEFRTKQW